MSFNTIVSDVGRRTSTAAPNRPDGSVALNLHLITESCAAGAATVGTFASLSANSGPHAGHLIAGRHMLVAAGRCAGAVASVDHIATHRSGCSGEFHAVVLAAGVANGTPELMKINFISRRQNPRHGLPTVNATIPDRDRPNTIRWPLGGNGAMRSPARKKPGVYACCAMMSGR